MATIATFLTAIDAVNFIERCLCAPHPSLDHDAFFELCLSLRSNPREVNLTTGYTLGFVSSSSTPFVLRLND